MTSFFGFKGFGTAFAIGFNPFTDRLARDSEYFCSFDLGHPVQY